MIEKIVIGTANFNNPYGILSGVALSDDDVFGLISSGCQLGVFGFDTALAYGDFFLKTRDFLQKHPLSSHITTKFSVKEPYDRLYQVFSQQKKIINKPFYGILIHDIHNIRSANKKELLLFLEKLQKENITHKVGISVYSPEDLDCMRDLFHASLIQVPLNPLNQSFSSEKMVDYFSENNIEVHARSLFLQGVFLAERLPNVLFPIRFAFDNIRKIMNDFESKIQALMLWASAQKFVSRWVLGFSSVRDFENLTNTLMNMGQPNEKIENLFDDFKKFDHKLVDPRNW